MFDKFLKWCHKNDKPIALTVGTLNICSGVVHMSEGHPVFGLFWIVTGAIIIAGYSR